MSDQIGRNTHVMENIGFTRKGDRYVHARAKFYVEFPRGPLAIGNDYQIHPVELKTEYGRTLILSATDSCRDRLAAFYHWGDRQSLRVAVRIAVTQRVSLAKIRRWSIEEGAREGFEEFAREVKRVRVQPQALTSPPRRSRRSARRTS